MRLRVWVYVYACMCTCMHACVNIHVCVYECQVCIRYTGPIDDAAENRREAGKGGTDEGEKTRHATGCVCGDIFM